ncbi:putative uncharacterized protein DDB_G0282133 [Nymphalis io]|uniref:putative uncharacterized protein DDB_G0282133 n=1 Tax=Inachis io TaxID=171585 RepID=UPI002167F4B1|nr:putative uncharacterized protein DDB_G0282133 [Nymphalis io]
MDLKELRANAPLSISLSDDSTKYVHSSPTLPGNKSKSYHDIGSNSMGKVDETAVRPCAIIGPDRVLTQNTSDVYLKKAPIEPWPCSDSTYRQPPDYPNKLSEYPPIRNISPRQTFQENMQRIMVPPTYNSIKNSDESSLKNTKLNMPQEAKYCDVPYNMNSVTNELKSVRNPDMPMSNVNPAYSRAVPHYGWPAGVSIRPPRPYGAPEFYQYQEYPSGVGPRPVAIPHSHRVHREEAAQVYSERFYQEANIRFKPYPVLKEKHQQTRYDYINNYQNTFHPPVSFPPHKYDLQKSINPHPYPVYSQVPLKYLDRRVHESFVDGYQRSNQQPNFNPQFHNQVLHPSYGPTSGNCIQNKPFNDLSAKAMAANKLPFETNNKIYLELDTSRNKGYPMPENVYYNEMNHTQHMRSEILVPNHSSLNMHSMPQHQIYRRENIPLKHYEYNVHHRNLDQSINLNFSLPRMPLQFSPNTVAISPSDSNTSNDTAHNVGTGQEDCGYVSQSSTNSVRSLDSTNLSAPKDRYRRHDYNIHTIPRNVLHINGSENNSKNKTNLSSKKNIDVRQFLQMWNEGEDEASESNKEIVTQIHPSNFSIQSKTSNNQEQLYVLGLVNVPSEELSKYEHIQKISKLPENIKGYNNIELLNQYEELLESPINNNFKNISKVHKDHNSLSKRQNDTETLTLPRPVSPLDVEAKISQSVIHKEVGCNFEIKPCSPEMLNVEVATPIQSILGERIIEKVANPITNTSKSPRLSMNEDNKNHNNIKIASCDMINKQYTVNNYANGIKNNNYSVQDFDSNSGICLASLPRLDNDIELNFPEINQQFIKANKIESDARLFQKDLPHLNFEQDTHEKNNFQQHLASPFCMSSTPEKEFSKLSKYRKSKKCDLMPKEDVLEKSNVGTAQQRINSVIIKNPDTKLPDDTNNSSSNTNNTLSENIDNSYSTDPNSETLLSSLSPENSEGNKMLSFETAIDFSLNKTDETKPYDCLIKCNDEPRYFGDSDNINFTSDTVIDKEILAKDQPVELQIKQIKEMKIIEDVVINNQPIENSKIEVSDSNASVNYEMLTNDPNKDNSIPVIKNISSLTEIEEYVNIQQNTTSATIQACDSLSETSSVLESVDEESLKINKIFTTIPDVILNKVDPYLDKNLAIEFETTLNSDLKEVENKGDTINANKNKCDEGEKSHDISETSTESKETIGTSSEREIFTVKDKNINIITTIDNGTVETVIKNKIDEESISHNATSVEENKKLELTEVFDEIKEIVNSTENKNSEDKKFLLPEQFHTNDQFEVNYNVIPKIEASFNKCGQETNMIDVSCTLDSAITSESNNNSENDYSSLNDVDLNTSEKTDKLANQNQDKSYNNKELVTCTKNNIENLENNEQLSASKENETRKNDVVKLISKLNITKTMKNPNKKEKYNHIAKELFSSRIQKLLIFNEGICKNVPNNNFDTIIEELIRGDHSKEINDDDKKENRDIEINSAVQNDVIGFSENRVNEYQNIYCGPIKTQTNVEDDKSVLTKDFKKSSEDEIFLNEENVSKITQCTSVLRRNVLKRSLSESALEDYRDNENISFFAPTKRKKRNHNIINPLISEDLCNIIQTNRRNSISTFYNEDNLFIFIDNDLIITEANDDTDKMYYTEIPDELSNNITRNDSSNDNNSTSSLTEMVAVESNLLCDYSNDLDVIEEKTLEESWVEDVACIETVVSEDVTADIDYEDTSQKNNNIDDETISKESALFCDSKHTDKIKNRYGSNMCNNDTQILQTLYITSQMNVNKTLVDIESHSSVKYKEYNDALDYSLENNDYLDKSEEVILNYNNCEVINEIENMSGEDTSITKIKQNEEINDFCVTNEYNEDKEKCVVHSCESHNDYMSSKNITSSYSNSSSPEVSSTTSEEKNSSILLKITNHNGSRVSKLNDIGSLDRLSYKLTEKKEYQNYNTNFSTSGTLITKAAQKYIPPLKETIRDLKIKLTLPQHRLHTLKQLQISKVEPKIDNIIKYINNNTKQETPKKQKPKFEDVLKSIDEIQFKKHKDKIKRGKNGIPKVVIKKNEDGAHYASSKRFDNKETYNPDLTGRKWQPWVFLEKNNFIDKMAIKKKVNAVYCHRKKNYVLAEKFRKYKSIYNANFVISQPSSDNSSKGTLKYTIRLKHK